MEGPESFKPDKSAEFKRREAARELFKPSLYPFLNTVSQVIAKASEEEADKMIDTIAAWPGTVIDKVRMKKDGEMLNLVEDMLHTAAGHAEYMDDYKERAQARKERKAEVLAYLEAKKLELEKMISVIEAEKM